MNVIGIVQTDMNEFNILFEQDQNQQQKNQQNNLQNNQLQDQGGNNNGQEDNQQQDGGGSPSDFFNLLMGSGDQNANNQQGQGQQQGPQEMTVRIKGVPEGQKATFLQMYQIIQDARQTTDIEQRCTVVSLGDQQGQGQGQGQAQGQRQGQNNGNMSRQ